MFVLRKYLQSRPGTPPGVLAQGQESKRMKGITRTLVGLASLTLGLCVGPAMAQKQQLTPASPEPIPQGAPVVVCFAEGTDPAYVEAMNTMVAAQNAALFGVDYNAGSRWSGTIGTPRALTWSFVPDGLSISGSNGEPTSPSVLFAQFDAAFAGQGGRATWVNRFVQVFTRWEQLTGLSYTRITVGGNDWDDGAAWGSGGSATRGDIRICAHPIDGGGGVLAYNFFPSSGDMVLDSNDTGSYASSGNSNRFLRNVVAHEHGHGMGLNHVCPASQTKLMEPFISTAYDGPRHDDIRAGQYLYGDDAETNDSAAAATDLGNLTTASPINTGTVANPVAGTSDVNSSRLSLFSTAASQHDYYKFTIATPLLVTVAATPVGLNYDSSTQAGNGSCNSGNIINSLTMANLRVEILGTNGTTVLGASDSAAAGSVETLSNIACSAAGTYYIRISASAATTNQTQLYRLQTTASATSACPSITTQPLNQLACVGGFTQFQAAATGIPAPTYQWRKNGTPLVNGGNISGATSPTLTIDPVSLNDADAYDCVATNSCGSTPTSEATLTVEDTPVITQHPQDVTVPLGSPATFTVAATDATGYQWRKNGQTIVGATNVSYEIASVQAGDEAAYSCRVIGNCGLVTSQNATLTIASSCYANCDGSTVAPILNVGDFACFLNAFASGDTYANCDGSTTPPILNVGDFACFLNAFAAGCP
jgi:hypothetical protein